MTSMMQVKFALALFLTTDCLWSKMHHCVASPEGYIFSYKTNSWYHASVRITLNDVHIMLINCPCVNTIKLHTI